jgi:hypothetical protein
MKNKTIDQNRLKRIAQSQRQICISILLLVLIAIAAIIVNNNAWVGAGYTHWTSIVYYVINIYALINGILLTANVYNSVILGIVLGIFLLVPCVNILILLAISQRATMYLKEHGFKVGFLGANMSQFD